MAGDGIRAALREPGAILFRMSGWGYKMTILWLNIPLAVVGMKRTSIEVNETRCFAPPAHNSTRIVMYIAY